jgi:murein DD-endopeptidase MepM/ murein hydrolase activator NlpD
MRKAFLRTPVNYSRISSYFNLQRKHPILNRIRAHKGVDYAAPTGTPIKAAGDGRVAFVGRKGGYGNAIVLQHGIKYSTLYGHLSRFKRGLKIGAKIRQGEIIGYVGQTGLATGPHLHYEFLVNGIHRNPLTVKLPQASPIPAPLRQDFQKIAAKLVAKLDTINATTVVLNQ